MCKTRKLGIRFLLLAALCAILLVPVAGPAEHIAPKGSESLVFVTQSDACECVRNLCVAGEQEVLNFLGGSGEGLRYERVDLAKNPDAGKTYRAVTLPVVLLFDGAGAEIARFDSFFTEDQLEAAWQQHLTRREGRP
ncbi:MAG TPA: hypothetical protein VK997_14145 [Deferrisomatales bacterium]|nr:hypothetical protein [Deferrisomatales bacterium]